MGIAQGMSKIKCKFVGAASQVAHAMPTGNAHAGEAETDYSKQAGGGKMIIATVYGTPM